MKKLITMVIVTLTSAMAFGEPITMFKVQNFATGDIFPGNNTITHFNVGKFDTSLGTLSKVTFEIIVEAWGGYYMVENHTSGDEPVAITIQQGISADITASGGFYVPMGITAVEAIQSSSKTLVHTGDQEILTGRPSNDRLVSTSSFAEAAPGMLSIYEGSGTYAIDFHSRQNSSIDADGTIIFKGNDGSSSGFLTVTYEYAPVPEATSMALLALGIVALGLRRKNSHA